MASARGGRWRSRGIRCSEEDLALRGGSNIHRIQFSEDPTLRGGSDAWRRIQLEEEGPVFGGSSSQRIQHLGGSGFQRIQLGGGSSTQRRIWCSEDPTLGGRSGTHRIQLSEDTTLGGPSCQRIKSWSACLLEDDPVLSPLMISQPPGWDDPRVRAQ